jgi:hypothetical protein
MSDNENQDEELNVPGTRRVPPFESGSTEEFEASLRSLRPRADGLDRRWRFLLAQEAAFNRNPADCPSFCDGENGSVPFTPPLCSRCGEIVSSGRRDKRRWAWPTAFSGMTAVAAALLAALVVQSGSQTAVTPHDQGTAVQSTFVANNQADSASLPVGDNRLPHQPSSLTAETSYLNLRNQVLRYGVDSWKLPVSAVAAAITEHPLSYREQLDRLLKQENPHGS